MIWSLTYLQKEKFEDRPYNRILMIFETGILSRDIPQLENNMTDQRAIFADQN